MKAVLHWLFPGVYFHYDSTSAGHKALGRWGGKKEPTITRNLRAIGRCIEFRFGVSIHGIHVYGHTGDAGNEAANSVARYAASTPSSGAVSARAVYLLRLMTPLWIGFGPFGSRSGKVVGMVQRFLCRHRMIYALILLSSGLTSHARTDMLMQQFHDANVHFVGVLETRMQRQAGKASDLYHVIHSPADRGGHGGVQIWITKQRALDSAGTCYVIEDHFKIIDFNPEVLVVKFSGFGLRFILIAGHAPHTSHSEAEISTWWSDLSAMIPPRYNDWDRICLVDANARVGEFPSTAISSHDFETQDDNGSYFHDLFSSSVCGAQQLLLTHILARPVLGSIPRRRSGIVVIMPVCRLLGTTTYVPHGFRMPLTSLSRRRSSSSMCTLLPYNPSATRRLETQAHEIQCGPDGSGFSGQLSGRSYDLQGHLSSTSWNVDVHTHLHGLHCDYKVG